MFDEIGALGQDHLIPGCPLQQEQDGRRPQRGGHPMNLPSLSVKRPVFTTMVTLISVILGAVSYALAGAWARKHLSHLPPQVAAALIKRFAED